LAPTAWLSTISAGTGTAWITTTDMTGAAGYNNNDILDDCPEQSSSSNDALDYTNCFIGTSSSTPLAAGVSGLLITAAPALTRLQVQNLLQDTADKIEDSAGAYSPGNGYSAPGSGRPTHGRGRINAYEALRVIAPAGLGGHDGVDIFLRDNRLDWGNTEQPSNTRFEAPRGTIAHWESMDIKVDAPPYQMTPTAANFSAFDDETPSAISGETNKVYVRLRNRGPQTPATAGVKLYWTQFGTALPPLPADFWQQFPSDSADASQWHPLDCAVGGTTACAVTNLAYSGASAAEGMGDAAQIVAFDFPAPAVDSTFSNHFCLVAMVDSPQDPISPVSKAAFLVDSITPFDNNVTHRNYLNLPTTAAFRERIVVRNPFDRALETALQVAAPAGWEVSGEPFGIGKPFKLAPLEEVAVTLTVRNAKRKGIVTVWQIDVGSDKATIIGGLTLRFRAGQ
ncbi:S8 family serine peptidase, partial [Mesorhizobium sp.]|uniref:S8 family serine peptidase n=1 Tax=Mesorhizobium sp. TaxID=1871066 RepID=UPI0025CE7250